MVSIVIPAYNEETSIAGTLEEIRSVMSGAGIDDYEILVVDDGSTDATAELAEQAGARVLGHPHNVGYGRSLKDGIKAATYDTIVILDADLTYPAESIPGLLAEYRKGFDMVVAARSGHHYGGSMYKGPLRKLLRFLVEFTAGREVPDANSGLRVFSKGTVDSYLDHLCDTFSFTTSQTLAYMMTGRFVRFIETDYRGRVGKTKVRLLKDSLRTMQYIVQAIIYYDPIKIFALFSAIMILAAVLLFLAGAVLGINAPYYLGLGCLMLSVVIFSMGLLADVLRQIMVK